MDSDLSTLITDDAPQPQGTRRVMLPTRHGAVACGPYLAGEQYDVPSDEAGRLVAAKRFEYVADGDTTTAE